VQITVTDLPSDSLAAQHQHPALDLDAVPAKHPQNERQSVS